MNLKKIMTLGVRPIDCSGTQACKALKEEGYEVILINSNPTTIMTDPDLADKTYITPTTPELVEQVLEKERPDVLLPTMGGQTALNLAVALVERGALEKYDEELIVFCSYVSFFEVMHSSLLSSIGVYYQLYCCCIC